jgi:hypothetical protein
MKSDGANSVVNLVDPHWTAPVPLESPATQWRAVSTRFGAIKVPLQPSDCAMTMPTTPFLVVSGSPPTSDSDAEPGAKGPSSAEQAARNETARKTAGTRTSPGNLAPGTVHDNHCYRYVAINEGNTIQRLVVTRW